MPDGDCIPPETRPDFLVRPIPDAIMSTTASTILPPAVNGASHPPSRLPDSAEVWVFDLDNTLYPAACNLFAQVDRRIGEFIADFLRIGGEEAQRIQKQYFREYGTTLRGLMSHHGLEPDAFLDYVHRIDLTVVPPNPTLDGALERLPGRKIIFTNGSARHAENVIARLGIDRHFDEIFDIVAAHYVPKPEPLAYDTLVRRHWFDPRRAVMIEDLPKNLVPAHAMGMTTVLIRHHAEWAQEGADGDHIHHVADDLGAWLTGQLSPD
jgi:putative hydrolase of the HAD superfamily